MKTNVVSAMKQGLMLCLLLLSVSVSAQWGKRKANKETFEWKYEVEANGVGNQGTYQIKVWTYAKNHEIAMEMAKKNAVHAIIFKGFPNKDRIPGQKALSQDPNLEVEQEKYFKEFFEDGGKFQKYVFLVNNGAVAPGDRIKISRKLYKIGIVVSVNVAGLRKELEKDGIIKALNNGF